MTDVQLRLRGLPRPLAATVDFRSSRLSIDGRPVDPQHLRWDLPVDAAVYGTLINFRGALDTIASAAALPPYKGAPKAPVLYVKPANTRIAHGDPIPVPHDAPELEIGASLGLVIGRTATRLDPARALEHLAGYTVVDDVGVPHDSYYRPSIRFKCRDGFCPIGPWIVDRAAVGNPDALAIRVYVDGVLRQANTTANLVRPIARLLADVTEFMTLRPGDLLMVGVPEGAPRARAGQRVAIEIDGVGRLENPLVAAAELPGAMA
jgi:5-oxopent-3-ene-1,2,5-tricarboxylate decarboxylase/2-hydroxyhepta-2,4-diene-1,7-dioate isomerase